MRRDNSVERPDLEQLQLRIALIKEFETPAQWRVLVCAAFAVSLVYAGMGAVSLLLAIIFRGFVTVSIDGSSWFGILVAAALPALYFVKRRVDQRCEQAKRRLLE